MQGLLDAVAVTVRQEIWMRFIATKYIIVHVVEQQESAACTLKKSRRRRFKGPMGGGWVGERSWKHFRTVLVMNGACH